MAITRVEFEFLKDLADAKAFPEAPRVLEIGQSNWYGDVEFDELRAAIAERVADKALRMRLLATMDTAIEGDDQLYLFTVARVCWEALTGALRYDAIDLHGTADAIPANLNQDVTLPQSYGVTVNFGTAEHVFNIGNVFRMMHAHTLPGGLMLHSAPSMGWPDHGFFSMHPTLFWDLAHANGYEMVEMRIGTIKPYTSHTINKREDFFALAPELVGKNCMTCVALRASHALRPFTIPIQGIYAGTLSESAQQAWMSLR